MIEESTIYFIIFLSSRSTTFPLCDNYVGASVSVCCAVGFPLALWNATGGSCKQSWRVDVILWWLPNHKMFSR